MSPAPDGEKNARTGLTPQPRINYTTLHDMGTYSTVEAAAHRGQQLLANPLVRDYVIVDPAEGILYPERPAHRQALPAQPQYE